MKEGSASRTWVLQRVLSERRNRFVVCHVHPCIFRFRINCGEACRNVGNQRFFLKVENLKTSLWSKIKLLWN